MVALDRSLPYPGRWSCLIVLLMSEFIDLTNTTIVNVSMPSIQRNLGATPADIQWIVAAYILSFGVLLITGGRLGDIYGRRRIFLTGIAGFAAASLICGAAPDAGVLIAGRVLQGASAAVMVPQILSIIRVTFPPAEIGKAFSLYGMIAGLAAVSGPILGGLMMQADLFGLEWRPIFLVLNIPLSLVTVAAALRFVPESRGANALTIDAVGVALASLGLVLLFLPLVQGREFGWPNWVFVSLAASVVVLSVFVRVERTKSARGGSPLLEMSLFSRRAFSAGCLACVVLFAGIPAFFLVFTITLQIGLGYTPLQAGLVSVPFSFATAVGSGLSFPLARRLGRRVLFLGAFCFAAGMALLLVVVDTFGISAGFRQFALPLLLGGLGMGLFIAPIAEFIVASVPEGISGSASGVINTAMQIGGATGIAIIGVIYFGLVASLTPQTIAEVTPRLERDLASEGVPTAARAMIVQRLTDCFATPETPAPASPAACRGPQAQSAPPAVARMIERSAHEALGLAFVGAIKGALRFEIAIFVLCFALVFLLPKRAREPGPVPEG